MELEPGVVFLRVSKRGGQRTSAADGSMVIVDRICRIDRAASALFGSTKVVVAAALFGPGKLGRQR